MELPVSFETKPERLAFYKSRLASNAKWALKALQVIGDFQTQEEQTKEQTIEHNGVGFSGFDGPLLTSFYGQVKRWQASPEAQKRYASPLSERQMHTLYKLIPKYAEQLLRIADSNGRAIPVVHIRRSRTA